MKALVVRELGGPETLVYEDLPDPEVGKGQVLIDVKAAGVNFPDLLIIEGKYQFQPPLPFSPGGEVAGVVSAIGEGVTRFAVGDRVVGMGIWGGYAEKMLLGEERVLPIPDEVSFEVGGSTITTYGTMLYALRDRAQLKEGETVLVLGAGGGVGTASIELAKAMGAKVIAASRGEAKLAACKELGADEVIDYSTEDLKKRAKALSGGGVDVVVDPVGGSYAEPALRAMGWGGRYLVIGFAAGDIPKIPLNLPLLKSCAIVGVFWGAWLGREPMKGAGQLLEIGKMVAAGKLNPRIDEVVPLAEGARALKALAAREVVGKVVLKP